jgi:peroxiredoxin
VVKKLSPSPATAQSLPQQETRPSLQVGERAPNFTAFTLDGNVVTRNSCLGKPTLLLFIAATKLCRQEMPAWLQVVSNARASECNAFFVANDEPRLRSFIDEFDARQSVLIASSAEDTPLEAYFITATPFFYLLTSQGNVEARGWPNAYAPAWQKLIEGWPRQKANVTGEP